MNSSAKLINVDSRQLLAFLEIGRQQSFAKAAEVIHLSPSGVSMMVKELERQVGAQLFERTTRSVTLTDAGRRLVPVAERIVEELHGLGAIVRGTEAAMRSRLDIAATPIVAAALLPHVVSAFAHSHPQVRVQVADRDVGTVGKSVIDGDADMGLGFFVKPAAGLVREPLCRFRLMRISPPGSGRGGVGASRPWSSLSNLRLLSLPPDNPIQALVEANLPRRSAKSQDRLAMNFLGTLIAMVEAGVGHAVVPSIVLAECLRHGLNVSMLVEPAVHLDLFVVARRGAPVKPAATDFTEELKHAASRLVA
ncbi:LysR family transcriptional regulator [Variovorax ureilyticus]|uniref:LysR family transcriptional regulator n=1 Tax=Variovorax ureilyticus TaxID=1836198 RepID=A0ABU8VB08_9BURK